MRAMEIADLQTEQTILGHVRDALRAAMKARLTEETSERWLERICFLTDSFARHLERLFRIEETDAYLELILDCPNPVTAERAEHLQEEHRSLLKEIQRILSQSRMTNCKNLANLHRLRQGLHGHLVRLKRHQRRESDLWLDSYLIDVGGEG